MKIELYLMTLGLALGIYYIRSDLVGGHIKSQLLLLELQNGSIVHTRIITSDISDTDFLMKVPFIV